MSKTKIISGKKVVSSDKRTFLKRHNRFKVPVINISKWMNNKTL